MSQSQCGWPSSQTSYPSKPWWAITPPTSMIGREPLNLPRRFPHQGMSLDERMRYYPAVGPAIPHRLAGCSRVTHPFAGCSYCYEPP